MSRSRCRTRCRLRTTRAPSTYARPRSPMTSDALIPSEFQRRVLAVPEVYDLALLGGRGGGKTWALALIVLRYVEKCGRAARVLLVRKTFAGLRDVEDTFRLVFGMAYGSAAS